MVTENECSQHCLTSDVGTRTYTQRRIVSGLSIELSVVLADLVWGLITKAGHLRACPRQLSLLILYRNEFGFVALLLDSENFDSDFYTNMTIDSFINRAG